MDRMLRCYKKVRNTRDLFLAMCGILLFMEFTGYRDEHKIIFDLLLVFSGFIFVLLVAMFLNVRNFFSYLLDTEMSFDNLKELDRLLAEGLPLSYKGREIESKLLREKIMENPSVKLRYSTLIGYLTDLSYVDEKREMQNTLKDTKCFKRYKILKKLKEVQHES